MDVTSYLLGKQAGGGGGQPVLQSKEIEITENGTTNVTADSGYDGLSEVEVTTNVSSGGGVEEYFTPTIGASNSAYGSGISEMIKKIPSDTVISGQSLYRAFRYSGIEEIPLLDTSNVTNMYECFTGCTELKTIPLLNTSEITTFEGAFYDCTLFETLPQIDTQNANNMYSMFYGCSSLKNVPLLNTSKLKDMRNAFSNCTLLTDTSLDNILQMCANANSYVRPKTLVSIGFSSSAYPASRIQALPHYQDFIDAGWTIGY